METYCSAFTFKNPSLTRRRVGCLPLTRSQLRLIQRGRLWLLSLIQLFQQPVYSSPYVKSWFNLLERLLWSREKNEMYFLFQCIHRFYWSACKAYQKGINLIQGTIAVGQCRVELNIVQYGHLARGSRTFVVFDDHMIIITHDESSWSSSNGEWKVNIMTLLLFFATFISELMLSKNLLSIFYPSGSSSTTE